MSGPGSVPYLNYFSARNVRHVVAAGNQRKHLKSSFAVKAITFLSLLAAYLHQHLSKCLNCLDRYKLPEVAGIFFI